MNFLKRFTNRTITENLIDRTAQNNSKLKNLMVLSDTVHTREQKSIGLAQRYIEYIKLYVKSLMI